MKRTAARNTIPGCTKKRRVVNTSVWSVASRRKRFFLREKSAIAPSTGIVSATTIAEMLMARVQMTVPRTSSPAITCTK